jgi:hypothetical protein
MKEQVKYAISLVGRQFEHKNSNIYTVVMVTNTDSTPERLKRHPIDVIYIGQDGKIWSRELSDWGRSFSPVDGCYPLGTKGYATIWFQMTPSSEFEKVVYSKHIPTREEVNEYFEQSCGGVYGWEYGEIRIDNILVKPDYHAEK